MAPSKDVKAAELVPEERTMKVSIVASQTDASEWVEYETDMKELYQNLKDEGIDVPTDDRGNPMFTPQFLKNLPPSLQPHAAGKVYTGGKPFKPLLGSGHRHKDKGALGRTNQTRTSIWEDYKNDLKELYKKLEKQGIAVPNDEDGVPILTEDLIKSLPPELMPHPAGIEYSPLPGVPALPDGTQVSARLTIKLLNGPLQDELVRRLTKIGKSIPTENGRPVLTPEIIREIPPEIIAKVLEPIYDSQRRLSASRQSVIRKLSLEDKKSLAHLLHTHGVEVKTVQQIPAAAVVQIAEEELEEAIGTVHTHDILSPAPHVQKVLPRDVIYHLSKTQKTQLGEMLTELGMTVDIDGDFEPIITQTNVRVLPRETLSYFGINISDDDTISSGSPAPFTAETVDTAEEMPDDHPNKKPRRSNTNLERRRSRRHLHMKSNRGLFHLTRKKDWKLELERRLQAAGIEVKMTEEGDLDLSHVPEDIVSEFTTAIQTEISQLDPGSLHERIMAMAHEDKMLIHEELEISGIEIPIDDDGNKIITVGLIDSLPRDVLINLLAKIFSSQPTGEEEDEGEEDEEEETVNPEDTADKDDEVELELTDEQKEEFYEKLVEEGVVVPLDAVTGKPKITKELIKNAVPKKLAREIIAVAANANVIDIRLSSGESSPSDTDETAPKVNRKTIEIVHELPPHVLGLRYSCGFGYVTDNTGNKINYEGMLQFLENSYTDEEIKKHEGIEKEKAATLRQALKQEKEHEEHDPEIKSGGSSVEIQRMAMRFRPIDKDKLIPDQNDPINLFEEAKPGIDPELIPHAKVVDFISILQPKDTFPLGKVDSLAAVPSSIVRKFSNESVRGSNLSTHLSDMPSMYSQALVEEPSIFFASVSTQSFDITPESVSSYREKWLKSFMNGYSPRETFAIRITNMITRKQIELRVCKNNTVNEVCHLYMQYEDHPEYYVWKDIYGRVLSPEKTMVENGLVRHDEVLEFQGYRRLPVILLYFRDGFENDPPLPLNPLHALRQREPGLCRNY
ncbi:Cytochrome b5 domain-containing protein 1 [Orchesella cincta]|uniref:Cytochrome b5 domain-containing protein 1 n=1 Tax=Orchesella cincta TaxID=48709 RepID=A0A1D2NEW7_ORCCI|nr:Cytochrome b5 domain-containing protein 1 [Orchesella cincta]